MFKDEIFLLDENNMFVFDRRDKRLFRIASGKRIEVKDNRYIGNILISNATVLSDEQAELREQRVQSKHTEPENPLGTDVD
jgi:hypothetical protein